MKKVLALILALLMCAGCLACFSSCSSDKNVIRIGVFEPASGDNAAGGKQEVLGIEYAHSLCPTVTVGGVEYKIELVEVDNQTTADKAPSAAQTLVGKKVSVVLGTYGSGAAMAGGKYFKDASIPAIGCSCTNTGVTSDNEFYFRVCYLDPFQGTVMANFAKDSGCKTAYVLTQVGDDYSTGLGNFFVQACEKLGITVTTGSFPANTADFSSYIGAAKDIDCIFAPTSTTVAALLLEQAKTAKYAGQIMAGDTWESSVILDAANGSDLKVFCSTFFDENDKTAESFVTGYKAWLNADAKRLKSNGDNDIVAAVSALGYDAYMTAIQAIKNADSADSTKIRDALAAMDTADEGVKGVTGLIYFDKIGDAVRDTAFIKQANNGAFKFVKAQQIAD